MAHVAPPARRWALGGLLALVLVADGVLAVACFHFQVKGLVSFYVAIAMLAVMAVLGLLATGFLVANLLRGQWHRAWGWLAVAGVGLSSYWLGLRLFLFAVGGHLDAVPPPG